MDQKPQITYGPLKSSPDLLPYLPAVVPAVLKKNPGGLLCFSFMFTDFNHISYVGMTSTSTLNSNLDTLNLKNDTLNLKNDKKQTESKVSSPPISEFPDGSQSTDSSLDNPDHENGKEEEKSEEDI
ncbi:unnamed protein product [Camellia sinensis]